MSESETNQEQKVTHALTCSVPLVHAFSRFHKVRRKRLEKLGSKSDVSEEELAKLRVKVQDGGMRRGRGCDHVTL